MPSPALVLFKLIILGLVSAASAWAATYAFRALAWKLDILDHPTDRKIHLHPIPYLGGMGIFAGMMAGLAVAHLLLPELVFYGERVRAFTIGALAVVCLGVLDDLVDVPSLVKLAATIALGLFMYLNGFEIVSIGALGGDGAIALANGHSWIAALVTIGWYVVIMNAINIIDGMDGLAAGVCGIAALLLLFLALSWRDPSAFAVVLATVVAGSCAGFLRHNWPPAHIFMGDTGSLLLGLSLASLTVFSGAKATILSTLAIPVIVLGIPIVDIGYAFVRRLLSGKNPFRADRLHLHHRLMSLGLPTSRILFLFYYVTAYLGLVAYMLQAASSAVILINAVLIGVGFLLLLSTLRHLDDARRAGE